MGTAINGFENLRNIGPSKLCLLMLMSRIFCGFRVKYRWETISSLSQFQVVVDLVSSSDMSRKELILLLTESLQKATTPETIMRLFLSRSCWWNEESASVWHLHIGLNDVFESVSRFSKRPELSNYPTTTRVRLVFLFSQQNPQDVQVQCGIFSTWNRLPLETVLTVVGMTTVRQFARTNRM